jgi:hypothetical protein
MGVRGANGVVGRANGVVGQSIALNLHRQFTLPFPMLQRPNTESTGGTRGAQHGTAIDESRRPIADSQRILTFIHAAMPAKYSASRSRDD